MRILSAVCLGLTILSSVDVHEVAAQPAKPNILVIFGDDIGIPQISAYTQGLMGYQTPNIDRIAREGILFTDSYGQQSCTAGRASFILGQEPFRTGLLTIGMPGDPHGIPPWTPTIADAMKQLGYATGQFGKNHLGDRDEHLPIKHGFDEFFGNLYHLNAEEEPEGYFYPKDPEFKKKFGPRRAEGHGRRQDRRHRTIKYKADAYRGRGVPGRGPRFYRPPAQSEQAVLHVVQFDPDACLYAPEAGVVGQDGQGHPRRWNGGA
jgi:arylsulfatase